MMGHELKEGMPSKCTETSCAWHPEEKCTFWDGEDCHWGFHKAKILMPPDLVE